MKESEAKNKVCPFMSSKVAEYVNGEYDGQRPIFQKCITTECMAWVQNYNGNGIQSEHEGYCLKLGNK